MLYQGARFALPPPLGAILKPMKTDLALVGTFIPSAKPGTPVRKGEKQLPQKSKILIREVVQLEGIRQGSVWALTRSQFSASVQLEGIRQGSV